MVLGAPPPPAPAHAEAAQGDAGLDNAAIVPMDEDDADDEPRLQCSICEEELPISKLPQNPDGTAKGRRCLTMVMASRNKSTWAESQRIGRRRYVTTVKK